MIDLTTLVRIRLKGGTRVHTLPEPGRGLTACGKYVRLHDTWGRRQDTALEPGATVTCAVCKRREAAPAHTATEES